MKDSLFCAYDGGFNKFPRTTPPNASTGIIEGSEAGNSDDGTEIQPLQGSGSVFSNLGSILPR